MTDSKRSDRPECTIRTCGKIPVTQHLFRCKTCHFGPNETMCENCANFCHRNHELVDLGYHVGYCWCGYGFDKSHCFLEHPVENDMNIPAQCPRQCNFLHSGKDSIQMEMFNCEQCHLVGPRISCEACYYMCHCGHRGVCKHGNSHGYCDCGDPSQDFPCKIRPPTNPPTPIPLCTFLLSGSDEMSQKAYICETCKLSGYICENCANTCHSGHVIKSCGVESFSCSCGSANDERFCTCKLMSNIEPAQ